MPKKKTSKDQDDQPQLPLSNDPPAADAPEPLTALEPSAEAAPAEEEAAPLPRNGKVQEDEAPLAQSYRNWFLEYASYVILDRAVPHMDDGLKPVQRRVLHTLWDMDDGRFHKVANVVGATMKLHPHGDASIGAALVGIAQRGWLIEPQGNFGNIYTGDDAAAPRYIEARLTPFAQDVLFNPKTTTWQQSYDGRNKEPVTLPAKFPIVLLEGAEGIAVGLATKILPHNLNDLCRAAINHLQGRTFRILPAFLMGWMAGLGYFGLSTWWIAEPFLVDARTYGWMAPFAVVLMGGGLALFWGLAGLAYRALRPRSAWKVLVFAGVFAAAEWLRGHVLTGFPWNLVGEAWKAGSAPSQAAALVGSYGLSWITLAIAATPGLLMLPVRRLAQAGMLVGAGIVLTALYAGGAGRLAAAARPIYAKDAPVIRVVQANIDQKDKWKPENLEQVHGLRRPSPPGRPPPKLRPPTSSSGRKAPCRW